MEDVISKIRSYYEECFVRNGSQRSRYYRMMHDLLKDYDFSPETVVLDYGTGTGLVAHYLWENYHCQIDAVDISAGALDNNSLAWADDEIHWVTINNFDFPLEHYDYIFSVQVIEHVHNVGLYLSRINKMLKLNGKLVISLPNIATIDYLERQFLISPEKCRQYSCHMLECYEKGEDHINAWDTKHFITLLASCGFVCENYLPAEGVRIALSRKNTKYLDRMNRGLLRNLCYTQQFLFSKVKVVDIDVYS